LGVQSCKLAVLLGCFRSDGLPACELFLLALVASDEARSSLLEPVGCCPDPVEEPVELGRKWIELAEQTTVSLSCCAGSSWRGWVTIFGLSVVELSTVGRAESESVGSASLIKGHQSLVGWRGVQAGRERRFFFLVEREEGRVQIVSGNEAARDKNVDQGSPCRSVFGECQGKFRGAIDERFAY